MKKLLRTIQLFFFPGAFREAEVEHIRAMNAAGRVFGKPEEFRPEAEKRIAKKRRGLFLSLVVVSALVVVGFVMALVVISFWPLSLFSVRFVRVISVVIIAWAALSRIGYETETISGETLIEITSATAFKQLYGVGVLLATFALFLEPTGA
jgi:hypothetical protein